LHSLAFENCALFRFDQRLVLLSTFQADAEGSFRERVLLLQALWGSFLCLAEGLEGLLVARVDAELLHDVLLVL